MRRQFLAVLWIASAVCAITLAQPEQPLLTTDQSSIQRVIEAPNLIDSVYVDLATADIIYINAEPRESSIVKTELVAPDGEVLATYSPSYFPEVQLGWITIPSTGRYTIRTELSDSGQYIVSFRHRETPILNGFSSERELLGQYFDAALFIIDGEAGQVIHLRAFSEEVDPILTLIAPDGTLLAENDDAAGFLDAELLNITLPQTGQYQAIVARNDRQTTHGFIHIELSRTGDFYNPKPASLDDGLLSFGLSPKLPMKEFPITAYSGGYLNLTVSQNKYQAECASFLVEIVDEGEVISNFTANFNGMSCSDIPLFTSIDEGTIIRLTLLTPRFAYFHLETSVGYGEG